MVGEKDLGPFSQAKIPAEGQPISDAKLAADLQAFALAVHLVGLEGLRDGAITFNDPPILRGET